MENARPMAHMGCPKCQRRLHYPDSEESVILRCPACKLVFRVTPNWEMPEEFIDRGMGPTPLYIFGGTSVVAVLLLVILTHMLVIMWREIAARKSRPPQPVAAKPVPKVPPHLLNAKGAWPSPETPTTPAKPAPVQPVDTSRVPETIVLHARDARTHGSKITYEVGGKKDNIGNWVDREAWVHWDLEFVAPGDYDVEIEFGCDRRSGGSTYRIVVGDQEVTGQVTETGSWDVYERQSLGEIHVDRAGEASLEVRPVTKPGMAVMNLRSITLRPPGRAAPTDPPLPHVRAPSIRWKNKDPALPFGPKESLLLDAGNAMAISKGWTKGDAGALVAGKGAGATAARWKLKFAEATTVRVEVTYRPAEEGRGMAFQVLANDKALHGRTDPPDGQASERRTDVLGTFAMPKGVVRINLSGTKAPISASHTFHGLRLTAVGE